MDKITANLEEIGRQLGAFEIREEGYGTMRGLQRQVTRQLGAFKSRDQRPHQATSDRPTWREGR
jgi:hypothetical protein